jgi:hypothetical protein
MRDAVVHALARTCIHDWLPELGWQVTDAAAGPIEGAAATGSS